MKPCQLSRWRSFLDSLDTSGGHIFVAYSLLPLGLVVFYFDATAGGQIVTGALTALWVMLKTAKSNREQMNGDGEETPTPPATPQVTP